MYALVIVFHIVASLVLILVVLLQSGKAGDLAATFGSTGSQTAFGARGAATVLTRATTVCAVIFMVTSLTLAIMYTKESSGTVLEGMSLPEEVPVVSPIDLSTAPAELPSSEEPGAVQPSDELPSEPAADEGSTESP
ncbi:MAG: preprotein translocase subunit SecG [Acidobacteria bacterium]|nr:MAG: preprotein translocase subunit SecG [Acidobacteriota bacterium]